MSSGKFTTILEVAMPLASLDLHLSWHSVFRLVFFFLALGF